MLTRSLLSKLTPPLAIVVAALLMARCGGQTGPSGTAPTVASIDPNRGPAGGGTSIHIVGDHFAGGATVMVGGVPATDIVVESAASITAKTAAHATGASDVMVTVAGRSGTLAAAFTYETDTAPVIQSVTAQGTRPNEPKNFADLDEGVTVTAVVQDPDTAPERLTFEWTAEVGTFSGTGSTVTWRSPADASTPKAIVLNVKVSDPGSNSTSGSATVSLHNSRKEVGDLSRQFLLDFSDSLKPAAFVVRNFTKSLRCEADRDEEFNEIETNRITYFITSSSIGSATVNIGFASLPCSYFSRDGDACASVPSTWDSVCAPGVTCTPGRTQGIDYVTAVYEGTEWKLCSSFFQPTGSLVKGFIK